MPNIDRPDQMYILKALFFTTLLILINSCRRSEDISAIYARLDTMEILEPMDSIILKLDDETTPALRGKEVRSEFGEPVLYFKVIEQNIIKKYNLNDPNLVSTIDLRLEGPDKLNSIRVCNHISRDTLICLGDQGVITMIRSNSKLEIIDKLNSFEAQPECRLFIDPVLMPIVKIKNSHYFIPNYFTRDYNQKLLAKIDFGSSGVELQLNVPEEYISGYFCFKRFGFWNYVYSEKNGDFYFNFRPNGQIVG